MPTGLTATQYLSKRSGDTHANFALASIREGDIVVDCGCGPGTITVDLARHVKTGVVFGIDSDSHHVALAQQLARDSGLENVKIVSGSAYELPFDDDSTDVVFSHALFHHLEFPDLAIREFARILHDGGRVTLRTPDWRGLIVYPDHASIRTAIDRFKTIHYPKSDPSIGRRMRALLLENGFCDVSFTASYECNDPKQVAADFGKYFDDRNEYTAANAFRDWGRSDGAVFAQAWCETIATRTGRTMR